MAEPLVTCDNLVKIYKVADLEVVALQGLDLEVGQGEFLSIVGASGSGKSTLLNIMSGLDLPSAGKCIIDRRDLTRMSLSERTDFKRYTVGHVWQQSGRNLLPELTVLANVELPQVLGGTDQPTRTRHAHELLGFVGLGGMEKKCANQLSGGEQQRAAIAVALANKPKLLLGDEPTGELDSISAGAIIDLLRDLNRALGLTIIIVTHDITIAARVDRTIAIRDGRTSTETVRRDTPVSPSDALGDYTSLASAVIGLPSTTHRESVLIDRVGRLQLPKEALESFSFNGRAEVRIVKDHIEIWPLEDRLDGNGAPGDQQGEQSTQEQEEVK